MAQTYLKIHPNDNVMVALRDLSRGITVVDDTHQFTLTDDIPAKHKFMLKDFSIGDEVIMYGVLVGKAKQPIQKGGLMSTQNVGHAAGEYAYRSAQPQWTSPDAEKFRHRTFKGYMRSDGRVGTANYWLFIPTVFCENRNRCHSRSVAQ